MGKIPGVSEAFLGDESDEKNQRLLKNSKWISNPELEFCKAQSQKELIAIVRGNKQNGGNRVYRVTDVKLIQILRTYAYHSDSWVTFYLPVK